MRREKDEFDTLHWVIVLCTAAALIAGLIEFNARRQAKANMRELEAALTITPEMRKKMDADIAALEAEDRQYMQQVLGPPRSRDDPRPLGIGERCMQHKRLRRIENGWEEIGTCR